MEQTVEAGRGNEKNFASQADVVAKFEKLAGKSLSAERVGRIRDWVLSMQDHADASELPRLLGAR
jgi:hypothetical protein